MNYLQNQNHLSQYEDHYKQNDSLQLRPESNSLRLTFPIQNSHNSANFNICKIDKLRQRYMQIQKNYSNNSKNLNQSLGIELIKSKNSSHSQFKNNHQVFSNYLSFQKENSPLQQSSKTFKQQYFISKYYCKEEQNTQSFLANIQSKLQESNLAKNKYFSLSNQLKSIKHAELIQILLEEIQDNEKNKNQIFKKNNQIESLSQQVKDLKIILEEKRKSISVLCLNESKNLSLIQKMEIQLKHKQNTKTKQGVYEKKYQQLALHMDQYINTMNEAQDQFKRKLHFYTKQNRRLADLSESLNQEINQQMKKSQLIFEANRAMEQSLQASQTLIIELSQKSQKIVEYFQQNQQLKLENGHLIQQLQTVNQENQTLKQKVQQLAFEVNSGTLNLQQNIETIRQTKAQSTTLQQQNKMLIQKIQQHCQLQLKVKRQNEKLIKQNQERNEQINRLSTQNKQLCLIQEQLLDQYEKQRFHKQNLKQQLVQLKSKVVFIQNTYQKQISKTSLIKNQLQRYWQNKISKEVSSQSSGTKNSVNIDAFKQDSFNQIDYQRAQLKISNKINKKQQIINPNSLAILNQKKLKSSMCNIKQNKKTNQTQKQNILNQ